MFSVEENVNKIDDEFSEKRKKGEKGKNERFSYAAPFHTQFAVLLARTWKTTLRDKVIFIKKFQNLPETNRMLLMLYSMNIPTQIRNDELLIIL